MNNFIREYKNLYSRWKGAKMKKLVFVFIPVFFLTLSSINAIGASSYYEKNLFQGTLYKIRLGMTLAQVKNLFSLGFIEEGKRTKTVSYRVEDDINVLPKYHTVVKLDGPAIITKDGKLLTKEIGRKDAEFKDRFTVLFDAFDKENIVAKEIMCNFLSDKGKETSDEIWKEYISLLGPPDKIKSYDNDSWFKYNWLKEGFGIEIRRGDRWHFYKIRIEILPNKLLLENFGSFVLIPDQKKFEFQERTENIKLKTGNAFGVIFKTGSFQENVRDWVTVVYKTPGIKDSKTGKIKYDFEYEHYPVSGKNEQAIWYFSDESELIPGIYKISIKRPFIRFSDTYNLLIEKEFNISF